MEQWTSREEAELTSLLKRKDELTAKNMAPLVELCNRVFDDKRGEIIAETLAGCADSFRDALGPFDSGIRCAPAETWRPTPKSGRRAMVPDETAAGPRSRRH